MTQDSKRVIAILGPTAAGKSDTALRLAQDLGGEIVSADSRQIYRGVDIGTAKPTRAERASVRHHLIDIVNPDERFTLADYREQAHAAIGDIFLRGKQPFLVGGTGLYLRAVLVGLDIPRVAPDPPRRRELERTPAAELHDRLKRVDPVAAAKILPGNSRRIIRALEVIGATGKPISQLQKRQTPPFAVSQIGLTRPRAELYARVDARVDRMIAGGLVEEVRALITRGYGFDLPAMTGLGYREIGKYLRGAISLEEAVRLIRSNTRKFIRHQANWFRTSDPQIHWFDLSVQSYDDIHNFVSQLLRMTVTLAPQRRGELDI